MVGWVGAGMEVVVGMHFGQGHNGLVGRIGSTSGETGARTEWEHVPSGSTYRVGARTEWEHVPSGSTYRVGARTEWEHVPSGSTYRVGGGYTGDTRSHHLLAVVNDKR